MRLTARLLQQATCRITLFTRANCSLCTDAKQILSNVWDTRPFIYTEIDVMKLEGKKWRDLYEFDTPVIHIKDAKKGQELTEHAANAVKLMHSFTVEEVKSKMDIAEQESI